jgi:tetratricopeptide (TPR) repeat protein
VLDVFNRRCEREPENTSIRYEFGMQLKRAGHFRAAYERFKEALDDPRYKSAANLELGECLQRFQKYPEALQHYRQAAESATGAEQLDCRKLALYRAGVLAAGVKLLEPARRYLSELVELDPNYKDAATRLSQL